MTMIWPGSDLTTRWIASAVPPFGSGSSVTPACWPGAASNCAVLIDVENPVGIVETGVEGNAGENALICAGDDDVAAGGDAPRRNEAWQAGSAFGR